MAVSAVDSFCIAYIAEITASPIVRFELAKNRSDTLDRRGVDERKMSQYQP